VEIVPHVPEAIIARFEKAAQERKADL